MPVVSVVLIFLNEERFLTEAVQSVCGQTLTDWELVLVDDGSTDASTRIALGFAASDPRIRYLDHPGHRNCGMAASRNLGATHTSAPYLAFLDGDDIWQPTKLADQVHLLEQMPDVAMVNGALLYWFSWDPQATAEDNNVLTGGVADRRLEPPELALTIYPLGPGDGAGVDLLVRRTVFDAVGGFEERFRGMFEDQSFLLKVFLRYPVYISSRYWILYRQHDASECARTSPAEYLRARSGFLDWLSDDSQDISDARVATAVRRARRQVRISTSTAPVTNAVAVLRQRIPERFKEPVRRIRRRSRSRSLSSGH